ncbi:hypothetical protein [Sphingobacterium wenxiniae]|uniref:Uncharacterized protein n=1 Tax=Sphingobacterium wenxiniae TaxID=683125 RepID=A0A1I6PHL3_9SPHI|nr:hypothetical protein [Sphingobacterium wenxiniae]SFS39545.1 hypothetical protein SAMN05660206_101467 [Sphingobacterium wenxiniae]
MKKIVKKISQAVQVVLLAPIKLPGKALNMLKYVAVGLGVLDAVLSDRTEDPATSTAEGEEDGSEAVD